VTRIARVLALCLPGAVAALPATAAADEPPIDVFVDAEPTPVDERADPTPAAFVLEGDLLAAPGLGTADALATVPGAQPLRRGGAADLATLSLRGATSAETPIYLAGVRLNDELTGTVDLSSLPLWLLDRIEVYRGDAPVAADELGMGGAVFLEPRLPALSGWSGLGALGVGSFGARVARAGLSVGGAGSGALVAIQQRSADDDYTFVDDGGTRFDPTDDRERRRSNSDFRETDAWALGRWQGRRGRVAALASAYDRDGGAPGLLLIGAEQARSARRRLLGGLSAAYAPCGGCTLALDAGWLSSRYELADPARELGVEPLTRTAGERGNGRLRFGYAPHARVAVTAGVGHTRALLRVDGSRGALERAARRSSRGELYAIAEPIDGWHVVALGAVERSETEALAAVAPAGWYASGRLGTRVRPIEALGLFANVGRYVRTPTLGELYGVSSGALGNAALGAERGVSIDAGASATWRWRSGALYAQLVGFMRFADDLIVYRRSTFGAVRPYNVASARVAGLELGAGVSMWRTVALSLALTALDPRDVSDERATDNDLIPLLSRLTVTPRLEVASPPLRPVALDRASVAASLAYRSARATDPAGLVVLDAQARLDLDAALAFAGRLTLRARVENVIDTQSYDVVGYPLPPRSVHGLVEVLL
jgi:iron complex outermembrane receptor protein